jgi:cbb3-type cytochrome oxidase maturation protein
MEVLIYLVPLALGLGLLGLAAFLWALRNGQFDDLDGAAWRAIMDDDQPARAPADGASEEAKTSQPEHKRAP